MASQGEVTKLSLDTFDKTVDAFKNAITTYRDARSRIVSTTGNLFLYWQGEGSKRFKQEYDILMTKLKDEEDNLYKIYEDIGTSRETYREWDESASSGIKNSIGG